MLNPRLLNSLTCYDEASLICTASDNVASSVYMLNPLLLTYMASYDVASKVNLALP